MTSNQALQASTLVGRDVLVPGAAGVKQEGQSMAAMVKLPQNVDNMFVRVENEMGQLVRTFEVGAKPAGDSREFGTEKMKTVIHCQLASTK